MTFWLGSTYTKNTHQLRAAWAVHTPEGAPVTDPIIVSFSEVKTLQECPRKWQWDYLHRYRKESGPGAASLGTLLHAALEELYSPALGAGTRLEAARGVIEASDDPRREDAERIFETYVEWARVEDQRLGWTPVAVEWRFVVDLPIPGFKVKGSVDLIVRNNQGRIVIVDHKSSAMPYPRDLNWWPQGLIYAYAWNLEHPDDLVAGLVWNGIATKAPPVRPSTPWEPFRRVWGSAHPNEIARCIIDITEEARNAYANYGTPGPVGLGLPAFNRAPIRPSPANCRWCPLVTTCEKDRRWPMTDQEWADDLTGQGFTPNAARST